MRRLEILRLHEYRLNTQDSCIHFNTNVALLSLLSSIPSWLFLHEGFALSVAQLVLRGCILAIYVDQS